MPYIISEMARMPRREDGQKSRHALKAWRLIHETGPSLATRWERWLDSDMREGFRASSSRGRRGKGASRALLREFIDGIGYDSAGAAHVTLINHKQIACAIKGQTLRTLRHGTKDRSTMSTQNSRVILVDVAAQIRHKQITHTVEGQARWAIRWIQHGKGGS